MRGPQTEPFGRRLSAKMRRYLFDDVKLKVLALLIVTVIWFSVAGQSRNSTSVEFRDVSLRNVPPGLAVAQSELSKVKITVEGPDDMLRELRFEVATQSTSIEAYADLKNLQEGIQIAPLRVDGLPKGIDLRKIEPETVKVTLDRIVTREFGVVARYAGALPDGYRLGNVTFDPQTVHLTGPASFLDRIDKVSTTTVSLANRTGSFDEQVTLDLDNDITADVRPTLHTEIELDAGTRSFVVPVSVAPGLTGTPDPPAVIVTLRGPSQALAAVKVEDITAILTGVEASRGEAVAPQIRISGPEAPSVEVDRIGPERVRLKR